MMIDTDRRINLVSAIARARTWEEHNTLGALRAARLSSINAAWFLHYPLLRYWFVNDTPHTPPRAPGYACACGV